MSQSWMRNRLNHLGAPARRTFNTQGSGCSPSPDGTFSDLEHPEWKPGPGIGGVVMEICAPSGSMASADMAWVAQPTLALRLPFFLRLHVWTPCHLPRDFALSLNHLVSSVRPCGAVLCSAEHWCHCFTSCGQSGHACSHLPPSFKPQICLSLENITFLNNALC